MTTETARAHGANGVKSFSVNGPKATAGYFSPAGPSSPISFKGFSSSMSSGGKRISSLRGNVAGSSENSIVEETAYQLKKKSMAELGSAVSQSVEAITFIKFVEWVRSERLATLPHKGSRWDTVLTRALYFVNHLHGFETAVQGFASGSSAAAQIGYGHALLLLQLGHENSEALDKAFGFFYRSSLVVSSLLDQSELLAVTSHTREQLCMMYTDLLTLVVDVGIRFYKTVHGSSTHSVSLDMYEVFGDTIETLRSRSSKTSDAIWSHQIDSDGLDLDEALGIDVLKKWLGPQDRVLEMLGTEHTTFADQQAEFTCLWFHDDLTKFMKSPKETLLLTGRAGTGKTTLAASIVERLQRPVARKSYSTIFFSIGGIPSQAGTLHVVKSLLFQLLNIRVGNMGLYNALVRAYEHAGKTNDPKAYEEHLWHAFTEALQRPLDKSNDLVIVIDGLDEVEGGPSAGQGLLEKLARAVNSGRKTKLIGLSQPLSVPAGLPAETRPVSPSDTRDDIQAVALRSLAHCQPFVKRPGQEQESIVATILDAAGGSFLWASLACEILKVEKSPESFNKTLQTLKTTPPAVPDLVSRLIGVIQPDTDAKLILAWLAGASRPLTFDELESLFAIDVDKITRSERRVNVHHTVHTIKPLLSLSNDVVRIRHGQIQTTLQTLFDQDKLSLPIKDRKMDFLLRTLAYTKLALPEESEPTLEVSQPELPARLFGRHDLLEYVVRYWTYHLKQTSLVTTGTSEIKPTPELRKVFPVSTTMPILEWICWDDQFPGAQEVDLHVLVGNVRRSIFTENHPTVLQSYINCAMYYEPMGNDREASKCYFFATTIGQTVLGKFHPLTVECADRFLRITSSMESTSRTEIMTQRERVLTILITAYEYQFGATSDMVVQTRQLLIDLYMKIQEQERATEIMRIIHGATVEKHGHDSERARDLSDHLRVQLGKGKTDQSLDSYKDTLFTAEGDDDEFVGAFDLERVDVLLREAQSQKNSQLAEQRYVELWQQLSEKCRTTQSAEWHERKISTVNAYSKFLQSEKRTAETSAILVCLAREYQHHELSYSESIISKLTQSAQTLKSVGHQSAALSIFKQASAYYKSAHKEQSSTFTQIEEEIAITSTEVLKQASSSSASTSASRSVSESSYQSIFHSMISNKTKTVDTQTMTIAKSLTSQYMEQRKWSEAVSIVHATLERTWSSFMSSSAHGVTMTSTFLQENVELVERLAECYLQQRLYEKVIDVYVRLFRAALSSPTQHKDLLEKAKMLLVNFYDKYGYPNQSIGVYQDALAVYKRVYGPSHEITIKTLYELGKRCRAHARTHPYWIEYYQQITTAVNKESTECHASAMEAAILVANSYWEERRYTEANAVFAVLWNTFVTKTKQHQQFSDTTFVQNLYDRYYQCLEATQADFEVLHRVTKQHRETCVAAFGASSAIAVAATVSLARVSQSSEKHIDEAISLFEEASKSSSSSTSSRSVESSELKHTLATLYKRRITTTTSSSASSETIAKAASMYQEQYAESKSKYGYTSESTLSNLREVAIMNTRQSKTDVAIKELHTAVAEINTSKTVTDEQMLESATSIAQTFQACKQEEKCQELVQELHRQLIAKEKRKTTSSFAFDLTACGSASLVFLAGLEYNIRKDRSQTFSEIFSDIIAENVYYDNFRRVMTARSGLDKIVIAAAPLRYFLLKRGRKDLAQSLEAQIVQLFIQRDTAELKLMSKDSPSIFIVGILDRLGARTTRDFVREVILASNRSLEKLIAGFKFAEAYDVANVAFLYAQGHKGYHGPRAISRGFELASYLDGRGENRCPDEDLRKKLLQLSNSIIKEILSICKEQNINMAQVQLPELNQLIALLGEQGDYETLESLLTSLWNTRDAQKSWPSDVLLNLGKRLICARFLAGHPVKALRLCEDVAYNLRRVNGATSASTLEIYTLLAQLYTSTGQQYQKSAAGDKNAAGLAADYFKRAVLVHEDVLRWLVHASGGAAAADLQDDDDEDTAFTILKEHGVIVEEAPTTPGAAAGAAADHSGLVKQHLRLLKLAYQRLGAWPRPYAEYEALNAQVFRVFGPKLAGVEGVEKWQAKGFGAGRAEAADGAFAGVPDWEILPTPLRRALEVEAKKDS